jgi:hypothetical protein
MYPLGQAYLVIKGTYAPTDFVETIGKRSGNPVQPAELGGAINPSRSMALSVNASHSPYPRPSTTLWARRLLFEASG